MIHEHLSAWITDSNGNPLEEHRTREIDDATAECWIPSEEGANFRIMWQPEFNSRPQLGLCCDIQLDGRSITSRVLSAEHIARGVPGMKDGMTIAPGMKKFLIFGRHAVTDRDDLASPDSANQDKLGVIQVKLTWVRCTQKKGAHKYFDLEPQLLHERAKKGDHTAATLGDPVRVGNHNAKPSKNTFQLRNVSSPVVFMFRYGSKDWLKAKGIMPNKSEMIVAGSAKLGTKRKHELSLEPHVLSAPDSKRGRTTDWSVVIDIDDLESDTDLDVAPNICANAKTSDFPAKIERKI